MALLPANADFFASGTSNTVGVVIVYQAPYNSLGAAVLRGRYMNAESGAPFYQVDAGLTSLPPMPTTIGAASIPRIPAGETAKLGNCAVRIDKVAYPDRVGGHQIDDGRFLAVTLTVTPSNGDWCHRLFRPALVSHPAYINEPNKQATDSANPNLDAFTTKDGPVTVTFVFDIHDDEQPYLIFTDSQTGYIRFDLGL